MTYLTSDISDTDNVIPVESTNMYLNNDYLRIENEEILYTGKTDTTFTGCTRGVNGTTAIAHISGTSVYTAYASTINSALGFNVASVSATYGAFAIVVLPLNFFRYTLPQLVSWNFQFLRGELAWVAYFFFAISIGLIVVIAIQLAQLAQGILRR